MSSTPPLNSNLISASSFLHLYPSSSSSSSPTAPLPTYNPHQIRLLVLEYLSHSCYADTARAFANEVTRRDAEEHEGAGGSKGGEGQGMEGVEATSVHDADGANMDDESSEGEVERRLTEGAGGRVEDVGDGHQQEEEEEEEEEEEGSSMLTQEQLREIRLRRDIRDHLLCGRIQPAVDLLQSHYPSVLSPSSPSSSTSPAITKSQFCNPTSFFVSTPASPSPSPPPPPSTNAQGSAGLPILGATFSPHALSLSPAILALNLQLQTFVELMRVAHSSSSLSAPSRVGTPIPHLSDSIASLTSDPMSTSTSSLSSPTSNTLSLAISHSQHLSSLVRSLPPGKEREAWERECIDVAGLLAYKDLAGCPVRGYLQQGRRETLAGLVNSAILQSKGETPLSVLELAARQATAVWQALGEWKVQFPPQPPTADKTSKEKDKGRVRTYPRFDLRTFLREREVVPSDNSATPTLMNGRS